MLYSNIHRGIKITQEEIIEELSKTQTINFLEAICQYVYCIYRELKVYTNSN